MSSRFKKDIKIILDYLWHDEKNHYDSGPSPKHIFMVLRRLAKNIKYYKD